MFSKSLDFELQFCFALPAVEADQKRNIHHCWQGLVLLPAPRDRFPLTVTLGKGELQVPAAEQPL